jgi:hypothetical protein
MALSYEPKALKKVLLKFSIFIIFLFRLEVCFFVTMR